MINKNIDIALLCETWLKPNQNLNHPSFNIYRADRVNGVHGGVAVAVRKNINHSLLPSLKTKTIESIGITVQTSQGNITFVAVYFPGIEPPNRTASLFRDDIKNLLKIRNSYFICGDFNSKHRYWNCLRGNQAGNELYNLMTQHNFNIYHPPTPTNFPPQTRSSPSTIDLVLSNGLHNINQLTTQNKFASDHLPIIFTVECSGKTATATQKTFIYNNANWTKFKQIINHNIHLANFRINNTNEIDLAIDNITNLINFAKENSIPLKKITQGSHIVLPNYIKYIITKRNNKRRQWQRSRTTDSLREYFVLKKEVNYLIFNLKNQDWNNKIKNLTPHSKNFWKITKLLKNKTNKLPPLKRGNEFLYTDKEKADEIALSFQKSHHITINYTHQLTDNAVNESINNLNNVDPQRNTGQITFCTPKEIKIYLKNLKNSKAPGPDSITNTLLKHLPRKAIIYMNHIFNACLQQAYFPCGWKHAKVIALPKPNKNLTDAQNFRPISLLNSLSKILEKILLKRLNKHLCDNDCIPDHQFGFRQFHSTTHQLARVNKIIKENLKNKKSTGMLVLDVEKAFDSVWHNGLIHKLMNINTPHYLVKNIQSFLSNRTFKVHINEESSASMGIPAGVPQGSCLSPTLYNIYTSKLPTLINCNIATYADDTAIFSSSECPITIIHTLERSLNSISSFLHKWKIKLNGNKTQVIFFTNRRAQQYLPHRTIRYNNENIEWSSTIKYLGVVLDKKLKYKNHIDHIGEKTQKIIRCLYPLINRKSKLHFRNKMLIYKSIFRPIITYGCPVWSNCAQTHTNKLQIIENKLLKIILKRPFFYNTKKLHSEANIPLLKQFIQNTTNKFIHNIQYSDNALIRYIQQNEL